MPARKLVTLEAAKTSGTSPTLESINAMRPGYRAVGTAEPHTPRGILPSPPIRTTQRKRGKSMSRRKGQNPKLRIGTRNDGSQYFYFQYWLDVPGEDGRKRRREIVGPVKTQTGGLT